MCCGASDYSEWANSKWLVNYEELPRPLVPDTCCKSVSKLCGTSEHPSNINRVVSIRPEHRKSHSNASDVTGFSPYSGLRQSTGDVCEDPPHRVGRGRTGLVLSAGDTLLHTCLSVISSGCRAPLLFSQIFGIVFACCLAKSVREYRELRDEGYWQ